MHIIQESCAIAKMTMQCTLYMGASHVSSQSRTRVELNRVFPTPPLVSPKFPHVPWMAFGLQKAKVLG